MPKTLVLYNPEYISLYKVNSLLEELECDTSGFGLFDVFNDLIDAIEKCDNALIILEDTTEFKGYVNKNSKAGRCLDHLCNLSKDVYLLYRNRARLTTYEITATFPGMLNEDKGIYISGVVGSAGKLEKEIGLNPYKERKAVHSSNNKAVEAVKVLTGKLVKASEERDKRVLLLLL